MAQEDSNLSSKYEAWVQTTVLQKKQKNWLLIWLHKTESELDIVVHTYNVSTYETEAGGLPD
jgi:hypothetical protein